MKFFIFIAVMIGSYSTVFAQNIYSIYSRVSPPSTSSGNGAQFGAGVDIVYNVENIMFDVDISYVNEAKLYVGNGKTLRTQLEGLFNIYDSFYVGGGVLAGKHSNSQYTKVQYQPIASLHYRPSITRDLYVSLLFPAYGNDNNVRGVRGGYRGTFPLKSGTSNWGLFSQVELTYIRFISGGNNYSSASTTFGIGISKITK